MKKIVLFLLVCVMMSLCACGGEIVETNPDTQNTVGTAGEGNGETANLSGNDDTASGGETTIDDVRELVLRYVDCPIEELIAIIGEPEYSDYAPSCLGDGEDGMLYYDGFIVYTYRENGVETVYDVE